MDHDIDGIMRTLRSAASQWPRPVVSEMARLRKDPYRILVATLISLRTKDEVTGEASERLFRLADTPFDMVRLTVSEVADAIFPATYHLNKAQTILDVSRTLIDQYGERVPDTLEELLALKGVGRKTANLVITDAFGKPGICVDTHVHRITNRWGYVHTGTPEETEFALREKLPIRYWKEINELLVAFGQNLCRPVSPHCSKCPVFRHCERIGVTTHR